MQLNDALVTTLKDWNVRYLMGVSGANIEHLHDAVFRLGDGRLQSVMSRSEIGASFMADCHARVHRTLGVCCATSGGGMMNLAVGVAEAYAESVPVLALVGQAPRPLNGLGAFQDSSGIGRTVDGLGLWRSITKYAAVVDSSETFWEQLEAAVRACMEGRPGPAALLIPRDVNELEVPERPQSFPVSLDALRAPAIPDPVAIEELVRALHGAERPVLLLGTGVDRSPTGSAVGRFARRAGIPVVSTMANIASFPQDDPAFLGMVGVAGHPSAHRYVNEEADLLVAVGTGLNVMTRGPIDAGLRRAKVAVVDIDPEVPQALLENPLVVKGDAGVTFEAVADHWGKDSRRYHRPDDYVATRFVPQLAESDRGSYAGSEPGLLQSVAIANLQDFLPERGHLVFDAGNCAAAALHYLHIPRDVTTTIALGMGGMGYAIAGAVGAQLGADDGATTMVFCGDGAFLMQGFEVHTAVELSLPILFVVFNNNGHGMCVTRQGLYFEGREESTTYSKVAIDHIAHGLGGDDALWVASAGSEHELRTALSEYRAGKARPGVLELRLGAEEIPPFTPFLPVDAPVYAMPTTHPPTAKAG